MLRKQWQDYALKAKQIAKHIVTGLEQDKNGVRLIQIVYGLDMYATDALNLKYSKQRSKSSVHTYQGGRQEISTRHADGSEGLFKSNGEFHSTNNPMDTEVKEYMNNNLDENKQYKTNTNMNKKLIRLTEGDLHRIVKESVNRVLNEVSAEKAYWLMQQRKQTPNTKAKTQMHYPSEFANRFNKEVYGTPNGGNMRIGNQVDATAYADPRTGNFVGSQGTGWDSWKGYNYIGPKNANFQYTKNTDGNEGFTYDRNDTDMDNNGKYTRIGQQMNPSQVNMHPQVRNFIGKGRARYNQIQQNYNQSQQGN